MALLGGKIYGNEKYHNYNKTIYWNPVVNLQPDKSFEFECALPEYKGVFNVVVEGMDSNGNSIYYINEFTNE